MRACRHAGVRAGVYGNRTWERGRLLRQRRVLGKTDFDMQRFYDVAEYIQIKRGAPP